MTTQASTVTMEHLDVGGPQQLGPVLEEVAHADGGNQHRQGRGLPQGLVGQTLDDDAQGGAGKNRQHHAHRRRQVKGGYGEEADVGPYHDDVAVGEVQHLGDAVDHGIAQGDDGVHAAQADAVDEMVEKDQQRNTPRFLSGVGGRKMQKGEDCRTPAVLSGLIMQMSVSPCRRTRRSRYTCPWGSWRPRRYRPRSYPRR